MRKPDLKKMTGLLCLIILCAGPVTAQTGLFCPEPHHDFGSIGFDFEVLHDYPLVNGGKDTVNIVSCLVTCDCSRVVLSDSTLAPGDTGWVRLSFSTSDYYGPSNKTITITTDDSEAQPLPLFYKAQVGQWQHNVRPNPVSLFYLPGKNVKTATLINPELDFIEILKLERYDDRIEVEIKEKRASKGDRVEMVVTPKEDLPAGTYLTNFEITLGVPEGLEPFVMTIPVKIVRY